MSFIASFKKRYYGPQGYAEIMRVGLPLVASMASSTVMQFTDRLFLAHYSVDAIAAALPAALVSLTLMLFLMGTCGYATVLIAQYVGSSAPHRVGCALWQGIWSAVAGALISAAMWWVAGPLFALGGHDPAIQVLEVDYFRILTVGSGFALLNSAVGAFYSGRGQNRIVMLANVVAAVVNVPLDYLLIFGGFGLPAMGVVGAGLATSFGWFLCTVILAAFVFTKKHEQEYAVLSSWRLEWPMFRRLLRYGLPSGVNLFIELMAVTWFVFEIGNLGRTPLAASNIAFSINSLVFTPMLGLNMAISALVGQSMGRGRPLQAERYTYNTLHLGFAYMIPWCVLFVLFPGWLIGLFIPGDMHPEEVAALSNVGTVLLYYIALYSLVDASGIIFSGALKGAGDTLGIMMLILAGMLGVLVLPVYAMKYFEVITLHGYWVCFTAYVMFFSGGAYLRFKRRGWHSIKVVESVA